MSARQIKPPAEQLVWTKRPVNEEHRVLGRRQRWRTKCKRYLVHRSLDFGGGPYLAEVVADNNHIELISQHRTLAAAQKACQTHFKETQT